MTNSIVQQQPQTAQKLARRYQSEGYTVIVEPEKDELPEFLRHFHPDLVALRADRSVAVEIKSSRRVRRTDYWRELAQAVRAHQGWHLEIVTNGSSDPQEESISQAEIEARIDNSAALAAAGEIEASLLVAWSAAEAAMRLVAERYDVKISDLGPLSLMSRLVGEGFMDRQDYEFVAALSYKRNAVAHGFRQTITIEDLERLRGIVHTLLTE